MNLDDILEEVARQNGVTVEEMLNEIEKSIDAAYENPNETANNIPRKEKKPTVKELVRFIVEEQK